MRFSKDLIFICLSALSLQESHFQAFHVHCQSWKYVLKKGGQGWGKKTEILVKYCSSNRGFHRYAECQESCDKMMDIGSVGWALSKCREARGCVGLLFSPAHLRESFCGAFPGWWLLHGPPFKGNENSAKSTLEGADFWSTFASLHACLLQPFPPALSFLLSLFFFSQLVYCFLS